MVIGYLFFEGTSLASDTGDFVVQRYYRDNIGQGRHGAGQGQ